MTIQIDNREKDRAITKIITDFDRMGIQHFSSKLFVGDYMSLDHPRICVERKQNLGELSINVSDMPKKDKDGNIKRDKDGNKQTEWKRFSDELKRAKTYGIKIIILCEHGKNFKSFEDIKKWVNPRLKESPLAISGERLYKKLMVLKKLYGFDFVFCSKSETGRKIIELLGEEKLQ